MPNGYGLYDMSGNVWEWCWDWDSSTTPAGGQDPTGKAFGVYRVHHGCCWDDNAVYFARAHRGCDAPGDRGSIVGLRLACRP
ncbi:SUMF1/EgtB/PvdO family nonheme iron enzyme [Treponema lecithinolyticum]|uniref:formylglycine-generating enzyme family protein n=2 Tax=Treponema lecithinolyticum TaxID=53418 RepID=UPI0028EBF9A5|nr:SUMF1/EgtB/PvdO family nonheme iron enzyme [Treponema lecithinolyticum]